MITINGKSYKGNTVSIINGKVLIDGKDINHVQDKASNDILHIKVDGVLGSLVTDASVEAGLVQGDVQAGGSVHCADVGKDVQAGGSVHCGKVNGGIMAGGSVTHG